MIRTILSIATVGILMLLVVGGVFAGGGFFPSLPPNFVFNSSGQVTGVIVLDPNGPVSAGAPATPTGTFGSISITRNQTATASAAFQVQPDSSLGELRFGCNLALTNLRFLEVAPGVPGLPIGGPGTAGNWLATPLTEQLFAQLGIPLVDQASQTVLRIPGIAEVVAQTCVKFPKPKDTMDYLPFASILDDLKIKPNPPIYPDRTIPGVTDPTQQWFSGFLVLQVKIGFWAAPGTPTP